MQRPAEGVPPGHAGASSRVVYAGAGDASAIKVMTTWKARVIGVARGVHDARLGTGLEGVVEECDHVHGHHRVAQVREGALRPEAGEEPCDCLGEEEKAEAGDGHREDEAAVGVAEVALAGNIDGLQVVLCRQVRAQCHRPTPPQLVEPVRIPHEYTPLCEE